MNSSAEWQAVGNSMTELPFLSIHFLTGIPQRVQLSLHELINYFTDILAFLLSKPLQLPLQLSLKVDGQTQLSALSVKLSSCPLGKVVFFFHRVISLHIARLHSWLASAQKLTVSERAGLALFSVSMADYEQDACPIQPQSNPTIFNTTLFLVKL
jgi:hypothetical protein